MGIVVGILIGIACAALGYFGWYYITHRENEKFSYEKFQREQQKIIGSLQKKRDDFDLQLQKEYGAAAQKNQQAIQQLILEEQEKQKEFDQLKANLQIDYETKQKWFEAKEKEALVARLEQNEKEINEAAQRKSESLLRLEADYKDKSQELENQFQLYSNELFNKKQQLDNEIQSYEEKQKAIIEQFKKAEEMKQKQDFYHISLNDVEKRDVVQLKKLALEFSKPEIIFKLLYEVYYKNRLEELFKRVIGNNKGKGGIYKITNIENQKIYVGRTVDYLSRWRTHAKRGCNIERISGQLYDAMFTEGLENFTFEIVEVCDKDEQATKEKYWIQFYHSDLYGYNGNKGG